MSIEIDQKINVLIYKRVISVMYYPNMILFYCKLTFEIYRLSSEVNSTITMPLGKS